MSINHISAFDGCYIMQRKDIERFADTLADGFSCYNLFEYVCNQKYDHAKMKLFWAVQLELVADNAICIADSESVNSVLVYIRPKSKEPGLFEYLKRGGVKMVIGLGLRCAIRLLRFDLEAQGIAKRHKGDEDGYLMAFATRLDKQGQSYGKPLMVALLRYLDASGDGCYLETLKAGNVDLYKHFSFELKEQTTIKLGGLTLFAMLRPKR